mmetsp:Transcript_19220/g.31924  ORF Transcript_19220/g.31924 Transcript_19220/m.31924 type:complete len:739 (+) Transcript_19220:51-2267(+)|eukprot:CAMPEP_0119011182 /NCGR_PEP_ID=MMETSP1176-20130426/5504_1 /TAXON_ID=265551 /ORGANISM="Synedropsis recta cf, Strain CCMP1620" /LENGTH=738 /DNA_ID=CAMNT_0006963963 /DNA_START=13 /DNA_END=2229 /DNA_ORIENTATION=+
MSVVAYRPVRSRRQPATTTAHRLRFHHQAAYYSTAFFLVALAIASIASPSSTAWDRELWEYQHARHLADNNAAADDGSTTSTDYTAYSCNSLFETVPNHGQDQCQFAKTCNQGQGLFASFVFCNKHISYKVWTALLSPFLLLWMMMLFRMLGSTAEDYFSPSLELFSLKLGLPPRFAGVSLLALGNGAADVSATRNAITSDVQNGYLMALGALTGAAMFIGAVVSGVIIISGDGVPCRGALVRDVAALFITSIVVMWQLSSGSIGPAAISVFCSMYLVFVAIVLVADVYHRAIVLPRLQTTTQQAELTRQQDESVRAQDAAGDALNDMAAVASTTSTGDNRGFFSKMMTAISNYDNTTTTTDGTGTNQQPNGGWGVESDDVINERPVVLHGANGILSPGNNRSATSSSNNNQSQEQQAEPSVGNYTMLEDGIDNICAETGTGSFSAHNWSGAWKDGLYELEMELHDVWKEIMDNDEAPFYEKALLICEFPFTIFRKLSVSIPCEGYYSRATVAASLVLSSVWFAFYMWDEHDANIFWMPTPIFYFHFTACLICGALVLRYAPGGDGVMNLKVATPIALYGFIVAATWIDWIADHLVALLEFLGIVCRIPGSIMGLTILAWGNSMGDLSANMTMARKGLANMAMTACFAGPVFNILIGLSFGFSSLSAQTGIADHDVALSPSIITGFIFIMVNTVLVVIVGTCVNQGRIPKEYGYGLIGLYLIYVVLSVLMQFSKYGDS